MKNQTILIVGASGTVGQELVRILKSQNETVRTTTSRQLSVTHEEQVYLNLATGEGLKAAFEGVEKAFFLSPPGYADQYKMLSPLIQEAKRRGLQKVVLMTAMGANADEASPFRRAEVELEKSGLNYNIVRPNWFLQNFTTFWLHGIREQRKIQLPAGDAKTSFIDAKDISAVIAKLLTTELFANRDFDLTGPASVTHGDVAAAISEVIGEQVTYEDIEPYVLKDRLVQAGLPVDYVDFMMMIMGFLKAGNNETVSGNVEMILGRSPSSLQQFVMDAKQVW